MPFKSWEDCPDGAFKDALRSIVQDSPTSLALDTLVQNDDQLDILCQTLREVAHHTVDTISLRCCNLKSEESVAILSQLVSETWENEKPKGVIMHAPNLFIIETLYLR